MKKISRRSFLAVAGASTAALALTACGGSSSSTAASSTASSAPASSAAGDASGAAADPKVTLVYAEVNPWTPSWARPVLTSREGRGADRWFRRHRPAGFRRAGL